MDVTPKGPLTHRQLQLLTSLFSSSMFLFVPHDSLVVMTVTGLVYEIRWEKNYFKNVALPSLISFVVSVDVKYQLWCLLTVWPYYKPDRKVNQPEIRLTIVVSFCPDQRAFRTELRRRNCDFLHHHYYYHYYLGQPWCVSKKTPNQ